MAWSPQLDYRTEGGRLRGARLVTCTALHVHVSNMYVTLAGKGLTILWPPVRDAPQARQTSYHKSKRTR